MSQPVVIHGLGTSRPDSSYALGGVNSAIGALRWRSVRFGVMRKLACSLSQQGMRNCAITARLGRRMPWAEIARNTIFRPT